MTAIPAAMQAAIDSLEPVIRRAFIAAVADIRSTAQMAIIVKAIEDGRVDDVIRALASDPNFWAPLDDTIRAAYLQGGRDAIAALPVIPDPAGPGKRLSALGEPTPGRNGGPVRMSDG